MNAHSVQILLAMGRASWRLLGYLPKKQMPFWRQTTVWLLSHVTTAPIPWPSVVSCVAANIHIGHCLIPLPICTPRMWLIIHTFAQYEYLCVWRAKCFIQSPMFKYVYTCAFNAPTCAQLDERSQALASSVYLGLNVLPCARTFISMPLRIRSQRLQQWCRPVVQQATLAFFL